MVVYVVVTTITIYSQSQRFCLLFFLNQGKSISVQPDAILHQKLPENLLENAMPGSLISTFRGSPGFRRPNTYRAHSWLCIWCTAKGVLCQYHYEEGEINVFSYFINYNFASTSMPRYLQDHTIYNCIGGMYNIFYEIYSLHSWPVTMELIKGHLCMHVRQVCALFCGFY